MIIGNIDFENRIIQINRTIGRGIEGTPKTLSSYRNIPIFKSLQPCLVNQLELTGDKDTYVFLNDLGNNFLHSFINLTPFNFGIL